jgi:hypothetical protein
MVIPAVRLHDVKSMMAPTNGIKNAATNDAMAYMEVTNDEG